MLKYSYRRVKAKRARSFMFHKFFSTLTICFCGFVLSFISQEQELAPLLIWLNGGPGVSSMWGLFWENGPLQPRQPGSSEGEIPVSKLDLRLAIGSLNVIFKRNSSRSITRN